MQFEVRTLSPDLLISRLVIAARDEADARRQVAARGLFVSAIEPLRIYELSRLYLTLGMLSEGGIPIAQVIATVQAMVSPRVKKNALQAARASVEAGLPLSSTFEANGLSTPISLRMLRVGERTGDMGPMPTQSAAFYDGEISRWIERFTRTFEPLLMAALGLVVGGIVVLLYMPICDLAGDMSSLLNLPICYLAGDMS